MFEYNNIADADSVIIRLVWLYTGRCYHPTVEDDIIAI